jgi:hypothetical protein
MSDIVSFYHEESTNFINKLPIVLCSYITLRPLVFQDRPVARDIA